MNLITGLTTATVVGYEDLDDNGDWRDDSNYGHVWFPNRVSTGWAPYREGHWDWVAPWGWTWVDDSSHIAAEPATGTDIMRKISRRA